MWQPGLIVYKSHKFTIHCRGPTKKTQRELLGISRMGAGKSPTSRAWSAGAKNQPGDLGPMFLLCPKYPLFHQLLKPNVDCKPASMPIIAGELHNFYLFGSAPAINLGWSHHGRDGQIPCQVPADPFGCQGSPLQLAAVRPGHGALEHVPGLCALLRPGGRLKWPRDQWGFVLMTVVGYDRLFLGCFVSLIFFSDVGSGRELQLILSLSFVSLMKQGSWLLVRKKLGSRLQGHSNHVRGILWLGPWPF